MAARHGARQGTMGDQTLNDEASDLLYGLNAIAAYLRMRPRQAKHRALRGEIPTFKMGRSVCARKATLKAWLADREAAGT